MILSAQSGFCFTDTTSVTCENTTLVGNTSINGDGNLVVLLSFQVPSTPLTVISNATITVIMPQAGTNIDDSQLQVDCNYPGSHFYQDEYTGYWCIWYEDYGSWGAWSDHTIAAGDTLTSWISLNTDPGYVFDRNTTITITNGTVESSYPVEFNLEDEKCPSSLRFIAKFTIPVKQTPETEPEPTAPTTTESTEPTTIETTLKAPKIKGLSVSAKNNAITLTWMKFTKKDLQKFKTLQKKVKFEIQVSTDKNFVNDVITKKIKSGKNKITVKIKNPSTGRNTTFASEPLPRMTASGT